MTEHTELTPDERFEEYWKAAVGKPPFTHAKAIAKHAWDARSNLGAGGAVAHGKCGCYCPDCFHGNHTLCKLAFCRQKSATPSTAQAAVTECCGVSDTGRYCPQCGWECRIASTAQEALPEEAKSAGWLTATNGGPIYTVNKNYLAPEDSVKEVVLREDYDKLLAHCLALKGA